MAGIEDSQIVGLPAETPKHGFNTVRFLERLGIYYGANFLGGLAVAGVASLITGHNLLAEPGVVEGVAIGSTALPIGGLATRQFRGEPQDEIFV